MDEPQYDAQEQTEQQARYEREVKAKVLPLNTDVAGQAVQPGDRFDENENSDQSDSGDDQAQDQQHPSETGVIGHLRGSPLSPFYTVAGFPLPVEPTGLSYNDSMKILFLHGWQSVPGGVKPTYLAQHGHEVINPKLPDEDFAEAVRIAQAEFDRHQPDVVVGSSRGGAVAMNINSGDARLVLLCPAWKRYGTARTVKHGTVILHSRADDVVPFADSEELVRNSGLPAALIEVGSDHRLADPEPLAAMLEACEGTCNAERPVPPCPIFSFSYRSWCFGG